MIDQPNALETSGLFFDGDAMKGALLSQKKGAPTLDKILFFEPPVGNVNPLYLSEQLSKLSTELAPRLLVTAVETQESLLRPLHVKLKKEKDIAAVFAFQAEPLLPYPIENAVMDWVMVNQSEEGSDLMAVAVRKDHLTHHLERWKGFHLESEVVTAVPFALSAFARLFSPQDIPFFVLDIGKEYTSCVLVEKGKVVAAQSFHQGMKKLNTVYQQETGLPLEEAAASFKALNFSTLTDLPLLNAACEGFRLEVMKLFYGLAKQAKGKEVEGLLVTGESAIIPSLSIRLSTELNKNLLKIRKVSGFDISEEKLLNFAVPIGLALTGLPKAADQVNFRSGEYAYSQPWKRIKQPALLYFAACLFLSFALYFFGTTYIDYKRDSVKEQFVSLLAFMNKPYGTFETEYEVKNPFPALLEEDEYAPIELLSEEDLLQRLEFLEREIKAAPDMIALLPNVPRVSDVLAWLTTHPAISSIDEKTGQKVALAQIDNFSYSMVSRPEEKKKGNRYQVKIELEFTSPTPMMARELHDALIAPNDFVDPKSDVKWSTNRGKYKTSFYLKDKTIYPSQQKSRSE